MNEIAFGWALGGVIIVLIALIHIRIADYTSSNQKIEMLEDRYELIFIIWLCLGVLYFAVYYMMGGTL